MVLTLDGLIRHLKHYIQKKFHNAKNDWLKKTEKKVPFKRLNKPIDVAKMLAFSMF